MARSGMFLASAAVHRRSRRVSGGGVSSGIWPSWQDWAPAGAAAAWLVLIAALAVIPLAGVLPGLAICLARLHSSSHVPFWSYHRGHVATRVLSAVAEGGRLRRRTGRPCDGDRAVGGSQDRADHPLHCGRLYRPSGHHLALVLRRRSLAARWACGGGGLGGRHRCPLAAQLARLAAGRAGHGRAPSCRRDPVPPAPRRPPPPSCCSPWPPLPGPLPGRCTGGPPRRTPTWRWLTATPATSTSCCPGTSSVASTSACCTTR